MGFEPEHARWPPLRLARVCRELVSVVVVSPLLLREFNNHKEDEVRSVGRAIGLDVHRDFCEVAVAQDGEVRSSGRVDTSALAAARPSPNITCGAHTRQMIRSTSYLTACSSW